MTPISGMDRRGLLRGGVTAAALAALGPLDALGARTAGAAPMAKLPASPDYGLLYPDKNATTGLELVLTGESERNSPGTGTPESSDVRVSIFFRNAVN